MVEPTAPLSEPSRITKPSFKEVVTSSSQWFSEARKITIHSTEWDANDEHAPVSPRAVQFSKEVLQRLREPWKLTLMGKCLGISIRPSFVSQRVHIMWRPVGM